jgi:peptidoglycan/LPS O-acetylase OafA/YrhL
MMRRLNRDKIARLRLLCTALLLALPAACTGGINAGEKGGQAFIAMTGMLLVILAVLWIVLGREK